MSLVTLGLYILAMVSALSALIALLPSATEWPYPVQVSVGLTIIFDNMRALDQLLPVTELFNAVQYAFWILLFSRIVWPSAMWIFKAITRSS